MRYRRAHEHPSPLPSVSVVAPVMRPEKVSQCLSNFVRQSYPNKELHLLLNNARWVWV